jgi:hypothetical protein
MTRRNSIEFRRHAETRFIFGARLRFSVLTLKDVWPWYPITVRILQIASGLSGYHRMRYQNTALDDMSLALARIEMLRDMERYANLLVISRRRKQG